MKKRKLKERFYCHCQGHEAHYTITGVSVIAIDFPININKVIFSALLMIIQLLFSATNSAFVKKDGEELNRKETYLHK